MKVEHSMSPQLMALIKFTFRTTGLGDSLLVNTAFIGGLFFWSLCPEGVQNTTNACFRANSHLLEKIQAIGKRSLAEKKQKIDGITVPEPIKQRLLV
jgi:hypothetical protein